MSVTSSASTGVLLPAAVTATRSGMPLTASQAISAWPSSPASCLGVMETLYAGCPACVVGCAPDAVACSASRWRADEICATLGAPWSGVAGVSVLVAEPTFAR